MTLHFFEKPHNFLYFITRKGKHVNTFSEIVKVSMLNALAPHILRARTVFNCVDAILLRLPYRFLEDDSPGEVAKLAEEDGGGSDVCASRQDGRPTTSTDVSTRTDNAYQTFFIGRSTLSYI